MALMCPATTEADVDRHTEAFAEAAASLFGMISTRSGLNPEGVAKIHRR